MLKTDQFDELIQSAKQTKEFYEEQKQEDAEDDFDDYFVDEYPPHHYGEDGEVIIDWLIDEVTVCQKINFVF